VVGSLFALLIYAMTSVGTMVDRANKHKADKNLADQVAGMDPKKGNLEKQITQAQDSIRQMQSPDQQSDSKKQLAALLEERGKRNLQLNRTEEAEKDFSDAITNDEGNGKLYANLANLYAQVAEVRPDSIEKSREFERSGDYWSSAAELSQGQDRQKFADQAANAYIAAADALRKDGQTSTASDVLEKAVRHLPEGSPAQEKVRSLLNGG